MRISVLIPAYNSASTIGATLDSVLCQTAPADEILVMDDGSIDDTPMVLKRYEPKIRVFSQPNSGLSSARNALIARAQGDFIAFLDSDDLWHPKYLEMQAELYKRCPRAAAVFAAHTNFSGAGSYDWSRGPSDSQVRIEIFEPLGFLRRFRRAPGHFIMSFCCVPKKILEGMGSEPFKLKAPAEDVYFCNVLPFWGPIAFASEPFLGAYRVREGSLASNRLKCAEGEVRAFQLLRQHYRNDADARLGKEFEKAFASKRRALARILQGVGRTSEARAQLRDSLVQSVDPLSLAKSFALLSLTYFPRLLQPKWPPVDRQ